MSTRMFVPQNPTKRATHPITRRTERSSITRGTMTHAIIRRPMAGHATSRDRSPRRTARPPPPYATEAKPGRETISGRRARRRFHFRPAPRRGFQSSESTRIKINSSKKYVSSGSSASGIPRQDSYGPLPIMMASALCLLRTCQIFCNWDSLLIEGSMPAFYAWGMMVVYTQSPCRSGSVPCICSSSCRVSAHNFG